MLLHHIIHAILLENVKDVTLFFLGENGFLAHKLYVAVTNRPKA